MADSSSSSSVNTNLPDVTSARSDHVSVQVTTVQLNKENYSRWSPAITMGIAGRGRIAYVNGRKVEPVEDSMAWDTWYLEDNQVKTWIVNSVSPDIQPLILRKKTARDMWIILEQMYGQKKKKVRVYQLMKDVYSLRQGALSVADFYAALKSKWEDLDYHSDITWKCPHDQMQYMTDKWENRVFLFLSGLNDDFENIRSQILNSDESFSIEDVYSRVEAEEERRMLSSGRKGEEQSAYVSRAPVGTPRSSRKCTHCKKVGHTRDFCWDLHPEKKDSRGRPSSGKKPVSSATSDGKGSISAEQIRELRAYLSKIDVGQADTPDESTTTKEVDEEGTTTDVHEQEKEGEQPMLTEQEGDETTALLAEERLDVLKYRSQGKCPCTCVGMLVQDGGFLKVDSHFHVTREIVTNLPFTRSGESNDVEGRCVSRQMPVETLSKQLPHGTIRFRSKVVSIEQVGKSCLIHLANGTLIRAMVLIGCDGVNYIVAKRLGLLGLVSTGRVGSNHWNLASFIKAPKEMAALVASSLVGEVDGLSRFLQLHHQYMVFKVSLEY
ncbi:hypothetical protein EJ110_NYTH08174 [Nymphaea thermarum]|nr:hypothetical protein EJ110_NYTH08174 [Nymphaea thermarum]